MDDAKSNFHFPGDPARGLHVNCRCRLPENARAAIMRHRADVDPALIVDAEIRALEQPS